MPTSNWCSKQNTPASNCPVSPSPPRLSYPCSQTSDRTNLARCSKTGQQGKTQRDKVERQLPPPPFDQARAFSSTRSTRHDSHEDHGSADSRLPASRDLEYEPSRFQFPGFDRQQTISRLTIHADECESPMNTNPKETRVLRPRPHAFLHALHSLCMLQFVLPTIKHLSRFLNSICVQDWSTALLAHLRNLTNPGNQSPHVRYKLLNCGTKLISASQVAEILRAPWKNRDQLRPPILKSPTSGKRSCATYAMRKNFYARLVSTLGHHLEAIPSLRI
jgi:hypothetical protein